MLPSALSTSHLPPITDESYTASTESEYDYDSTETDSFDDSPRRPRALNTNGPKKSVKFLAIPEPSTPYTEPTDGSGPRQARRRSVLATTLSISSKANTVTVVNKQASYRSMPMVASRWFDNPILDDGVADAYNGFLKMWSRKKKAKTAPRTTEASLGDLNMAKAAKRATKLAATIAAAEEEAAAPSHRLVAPRVRLGPPSGENTIGVNDEPDRPHHTPTWQMPPLSEKVVTRKFGKATAVAAQVMPDGPIKPELMEELNLAYQDSFQPFQLFHTLSLLTHLPNLHSLNLSSTDLGKQLAKVTFPRLTTLVCANNAIVRLSDLPSMPKVTTLRLANNAICTARGLSRFPALRTLTLHANPVELRGDYRRHVAACAPPSIVLLDKMEITAAPPPTRAWERFKAAATSLIRGG